MSVFEVIAAIRCTARTCDENFAGVRPRPSKSVVTGRAQIRSIL